MVDWATSRLPLPSSGVGRTSVSPIVRVGGGGGPPPAALRTSTQSLSPPLLVAGGVNCLEPVFANGEPLTVVYVPFVGSYHCAVRFEPSWVMLTVIVLAVGMYAIASLPSAVRATVA